MFKPTELEPIIYKFQRRENLEEQYYLEEPSESDEEAVKLLTDKWKAFGGRMNPRLHYVYDLLAGR